MKVLVAEDDFVSCAVLEEHLKEWGYSPIVVSHGKEALEVLKRPNAPHLAILDWMMPYLSGVELCQEVQRIQKPISPYLILLTAKSNKQEVARALQAGANDYVTKPFDPNELQARISVGRRLVETQLLLALRVAELETAKQRDLQVVCCRCKKARQHDGSWTEVQSYGGAQATSWQVLCPGCYSTVSVHLDPRTPVAAAA